MFKLLFLPIRIAFALLKLSGVKGGLLLALGVGIGLLVAPQRGAVLRARLQAKLRDSRVAGAVPADEDLSL